MSKSEGDIVQLAGPFKPLRTGDFIEFSLFPDVPPEEITWREGVIVSIEIEVAPLENGMSTVQTLLGLVTRETFSSQGKRAQAETVVPLEALERINVESADIITAWQNVVPALRDRHVSGPVDVKQLREEHSRIPLRSSPKKSKRGRQKKAKKGVKTAPTELYISKRR